MPPLCTEIIGDSLPREADTERAGLQVAGMALPQVAGMLAHQGATRGRPTAPSAAIAGQPLTGAPQVTEPPRATGDSPAADMPAPVKDTVAVDTAASASVPYSRHPFHPKSKAPLVRAGLFCSDNLAGGRFYLFRRSLQERIAPTSRDNRNVCLKTNLNDAAPSRLLRNWDFHPQRYPISGGRRRRPHRETSPVLG